MQRPRRVKAYLIDIEGVLVRNKAYEPVAGSVGWMQALRAAGAPFSLVSNTTTDRPADLIARLNRVGFSFVKEDLVGALELGVSWLKDRGIGRICWLGAQDLQGFWQDQGLALVSGQQCEAVVMGVDPQVTATALDDVLPAILDRGVDVVCLHRNRFYLDAQDRRRLGPGCWSAALEALGGRGKIVTIGKPDPRIYRESLKRVGVSAEETLFISDDPVADLVTAGRLGMQTAFVLSGKHADHAVLGTLDENDWPDIVCSRLADLPLAGKDPA